MFLEADYFDLGVGSSQQYSFLLLSTSRSRSFDDVHYQTRWSSAQVRSITTIEDIGVTTRGNGWIAERGKPVPPDVLSIRLTGEQALEMCSGWGQYLPILWNCQHFAVLLTQMAVDTDMSARVTSYLFEKRSAAVQNVRGARNIGLAAIAASGSFVPVVGPLVALGSAATAGVYQYTDALKDNAITAKLWGFVDRYDELQKMFYYLPYLS